MRAREPALLQRAPAQERRAWAAAAWLEWPAQELELREAQRVPGLAAWSVVRPERVRQGRAAWSAVRPEQVLGRAEQPGQVLRARQVEWL